MTTCSDPNPLYLHGCHPKTIRIVHGIPEYEKPLRCANPKCGGLLKGFSKLNKSTGWTAVWYEVVS